jgi:hypothetical protein
MYPQLALKSKRLPSGYWNNSTHLREFVDGLARQLGIQKWEDWYNVTSKDLYMYNSYDKIRKLGGLSAVLPSVYPHINWNIRKLEELKQRASQRWLMRIVTQLYAGYGM